VQYHIGAFSWSPEPMLQTLTITNFALIERMQADWTNGLNVLIGETGAGKSILMDALSTLLGAKAGPSVIRKSADKAIIEGIFTVTPSVCAWLKEQELIDEEPQEIVVSREVAKSGSRFRINGTLVNQALIQDLRQLLISIHAQHEARTLLTPQAQLELLDSLGDKNHIKLVEKVRTHYERKRELALELKEIRISEEERLRRLDFSRFQLAELLEAQLADEDEDEQLSHQELVLANVSLLDAHAVSAQAALSEGQEKDGAESTICAIDLLQSALSDVERGSKYDQELESVALILRDCLAGMEEASTILRRYRDALDTDPETLQTIQTRLAMLSSVKRKYGPTLKEAIERRDALRVEVEKFENVEVRLEALEAEFAEATKALGQLAQQLSESRQNLAQTLSKRVEAEVADLGMERCQFKIAIEALEEPGPNGQDRVEFLIAPNPGQPLASLAKIASGGELSRVMLAIKSIFASADQIPTVVFDEIDTGLSGKTLQSMRDKLAALARSHQILCITHQPIIAAVADNHLQIRKEHLADSTVVSAKVLNEDERLKALAAMASGHEDEEISISFAKSLLDQAQKSQKAYGK
jgi:DNA repair protein RecN (Recombination protein N)